jgi:hypothetical protein
MLRRATILLTTAAAVVVVSNLAAAARPTSPPSTSPGTTASGDPLARLPSGADLPAPGGIPFAAPGADAVGEPGTDPDGRMPLADRLAFWAGRVERDPTDHLSMVQLAVLEAQTARTTSDVDRYVRADALLDRALEVDPDSFPALRAKAGVRYALHDFTGAADLAGRILAIAPDDAGALAIDADARLETGDLVGAGAAYERLASLASGPAVDARRARLAYLSGDEAGALRLATAARDAASVQADVDDPAFYRYQLAELARLTGDADLSRRELRAGLALAPDDIRLLLCSARLEAATGHDDVALGRLARAIAIVPSPDALALQGDLLRQSGDDEAAQATFATVDAIAQLATAAGPVYDRQLALFALDHGRGDASLVARLRDMLAERPDAYGHDLLAWALHRTGDDAAAAVEAEAALAGGIRDARILYHAGIIELARGDDEVGRAYLTDALARSTALTPAEISAATDALGDVHDR